MLVLYESIWLRRGIGSSTLILSVSFGKERRWETTTWGSHSPLMVMRGQNMRSTFPCWWWDSSTRGRHSTGLWWESNTWGRHSPVLVMRVQFSRSIFQVLEMRVQYLRSTFYSAVMRVQYLRSTFPSVGDRSLVLEVDIPQFWRWESSTRGRHSQCWRPVAHILLVLIVPDVGDQGRRDNLLGLIFLSVCEGWEGRTIYGGR